MTPRRMLGRAGAALLAGAVVGCFTGEDLAGQPCKTDDDCNAVPALGGRLACLHGVCGTCGDGVVQAPEACDDGDDDDDDECTNACALAACGDGHVQADVEVCDDGNADRHDGCLDCRPAACGDGVVWEGEEECDVDDPPRCQDCLSVVCGNGVVQYDEECDDGDDDELDECTSACKFTRCGDGAVQAGEECDDANLTDTDACVGCRLARCGDGAVQAGVEACDDENDGGLDGCNTRCELGAERLFGGSTARHTCGVRDGRARCWGRNEQGQLGAGTYAFLGDEGSDYPIAADVALTGVEDGAAGGQHTCVRVRSGAVHCWGWNGFGQVGLPRDDPASAPAPGSAPVFDDAVALVAGHAHTCAVLARDGGARCWGINEGRAGVGTLGYADPDLADDGGSPHFPTPNQDAVPLGAAVVQISAGGFHTCALLADGAVRCWGDNEHGQLGRGDVETIGDDETPDSAAPIDFAGAAVTQISAGNAHTCALVDGRVWCWGHNSRGQLGYEHTDDVGAAPDRRPRDAGPVALLAASQQVDRVVAGGDHTCALLVGGDVLCWGANGSGQLGRGDDDDLGGAPGDVDRVVRVALGEVPPVDLRLGADHGCALLADGQVRCWGSDAYGQLFVGLFQPGNIGDEPDELPPCPTAIYAANPRECHDAMP